MQNELKYLHIIEAETILFCNRWFKVSRIASNYHMSFDYRVKAFFFKMTINNVKDQP